MIPESPEAVLRYILMRVHDTPRPTAGEEYYSDQHIQQIQSWFGGRLAADFDYGDLYDMNFSSEDEVPPALIVNDDAYIHMPHNLPGLCILTRDMDGHWKLRIALETCWDCFGNLTHYNRELSRKTLCRNCGGTGWGGIGGGIGSDLAFCASHDLPVDPANLILTNSPREAFLHLQTQIEVLQPLQDVSQLDISPALARGNRAKIVVTTSETQYLAVMQKNADEYWYLSAFVSKCSVCNGHGYESDLIPCPACGGLKWGKAGDLRYIRNDAPDGWQLLP